MPEDADFAEKALWKSLKPLDIETLGQYFYRASGFEHNLSFVGLVYNEWKQSSDLPMDNDHFGTKMGDGSDVAHGINRIIAGFGTVTETTIRAGKQHGLSRTISGVKYVMMQYFEEGTLVASFGYDNGQASQTWAVYGAAGD